MKFWETVGKIIGDMYAAVWRNTPGAGRPFTYIIREWVKNNPGKATILLPVIFAALLAVARLFGSHFWVVCLCAFCWLLTGHCFWDTAGQYIKPKRFKKE